MLQGRLWCRGSFIRFFVGATFSVTGSWFNTVAIAVLTFRITGQVSAAAGAIALSVVPRAILGPLGGVVADAFERRTSMIVIDVIRAVISLAPLLVHDRSTLWIVYTSVVLSQAASVFYGQRAYVSALVPDDLLEGANAAVAIMLDVGLVAGASLASVLIGALGPDPAFIINALSFAVSAGLLLTLPRARNVVESTQSTVSRMGALLWGYGAIIRRYPRVTALYVGYAVNTTPIVFFQAVLVAYVAFLHQPLSFTGVLYAAAGVGGIVGGVAMGQYFKQLPYGVALSIFASSVLLLGALAFASGLWVALILFALSTAAGTAGDVVVLVTIQRLVASDEQGRAFGLLNWTSALGQLLGAVLGLLLAKVAIAGLFWVSVIAFVIVVVSLTASARAEPRRSTPLPLEVVVGVGNATAMAAE